MSKNNPPPWFDSQTPDSEEDFQKRRAELLRQLPELLARQKDRGRANRFYPSLLVRSVLGDRGDRPFNGCFWESPDIWTAPNDPTTSPAIPPTHGGEVVAGRPCTVYAHVWNLGLAPLAGIHVEFYWFNPSLGIDGTHGNLIGTARCELAARGMPGSHRLVKCPKAWTPIIENNGHECLVVRLFGIGDPLGGNEWHPWQNRHVAQRNISVVAVDANLDKFVGLIDLSRPHNTRTQLIQLGAIEGELARQLAAPNLKLAQIDPQVLAEIDLSGTVTMPSLTEVPAGMKSSVHPLATGVAKPLPILHPAGSVPVIDPHVIFQQLAPRAVQSPGPARLTDLLSKIPVLHPGETRGVPPPGEAYVLRLASYNGDQLVGGYTLVVKGV
jgi:hypothetical protein